MSKTLIYVKNTLNPLLAFICIFNGATSTFRYCSPKIIIIMKLSKFLLYLFYSTVIIIVFLWKISILLLLCLQESFLFLFLFKRIFCHFEPAWHIYCPPCKKHNLFVKTFNKITHFNIVKSKLAKRFHRIINTLLLIRFYLCWLNSSTK